MTLLAGTFAYRSKLRFYPAVEEGASARLHKSSRAVLLCRRRHLVLLEVAPSSIAAVDEGDSFR